MPFMKPPLMLCTTRPKNRCSACERRLRSKDVKGWKNTSYEVNYHGFHVELEAIVETIVVSLVLSCLAFFPWPPVCFSCCFASGLSRRDWR